jgi:hypothetical protein
MLLWLLLLAADVGALVVLFEAWRSKAVTPFLLRTARASVWLALAGAFVVVAYCFWRVWYVYRLPLPPGVNPSAVSYIRGEVLATLAGCAAVAVLLLGPPFFARHLLSRISASRPR